MNEPKLCIDCKHYRPAWSASQINSWGMLNANARDPVTGKLVDHGEPQRVDECRHPKNAKRTDGAPRCTPGFMRAEDDADYSGFEALVYAGQVCGEKAKWFEPKEQE